MKLLMKVFTNFLNQIKNGKNVQLKLIRTHYKPDCTLGYIDLGESVIYTLELPWNGNKRNISCIPRGTYPLTPHNWEDKKTFQFSKVWQICNVPDRSAILIHAGNTVDDIKGCVAVGMAMGKFHGRDAIFSSQKALGILRKHIGPNNGQITIEDAADVVVELPKGEKP